MATTRVFFDMTADGAPVGKIIMEVRLTVILFHNLPGSFLALKLQLSLY